MTQSPRRSRTSLKLPPSLYQGIDLYALAASTAGVGMLAFAQPAEARIVFTPTHRTLTSGTLPIPIGGTNAFNLTDKSYVIPGSWTTQLLDINASANAAVVGHNGSASALPPGKTIGPANQFQTGKALMAGAFRETQISASTVFGPFANTTLRFLGLRFTIKGTTHYGWARFRKVTASASGGPTVTAVLTGFAYETIPNKSIVAGKTEGPNVVQPTPQLCVRPLPNGRAGPTGAGSAGIVRLAAQGAGPARQDLSNRCVVGLCFLLRGPSPIR